MNREAALPAGFKMTELGLLPEEWELHSLGSLFDSQQGKSLSAKENLGKNPKPFLRTANVFWGKIDVTSVDMMDFKDNEFDNLCLKKGDLLVCEGGDIGRTAIWNDEMSRCAYQNHLHRLRPSQKDVYPLFYMYWMQEAIVQLGLYIGSGNKTTIPNLSQSRLKAFVFPKPPLLEQRAIAHVLSAIQCAIEAQDKVISAAGELKKSLMRHLFTYGPISVNEIDQVELKETDIGSICDKWQVMQLEEAVIEAQYGLSIKGATTGQFPILRMNNLFKGKITTNNMQYVDLDDRELKKFKLNKGDILFNRTNSYELVGKTSLFDLTGTYVFASNLIRMAVNRAVLYAPYLNYFLNTCQGQLSLKAVASRAVSQSNISASKLRSLRIPVPTLNEQRSISDVLVAVDTKLVFEENRKSALQSLFKTMLHLLMTGQLRVKDLKIEN